jgi:hypothetical protein
LILFEEGKDVVEWANEKGGRLGMKRLARDILAVLGVADFVNQA